MATKLKKPSKKERRDRTDIMGIKGILPLLSEVFNIQPPEVSVEDLLACEPDRIFEIYNFFLRCISLIGAEDLATPLAQKSNLKSDIFSKDLPYPCYKIRFFLAVREMLVLSNGPRICWKDIAAPELTRTMIFFKNLINFLRFYSDETLLFMNEKQEESSLLSEVALLRRDVSESLERHEMHLAKADMEDNAKANCQEEIAGISTELESLSKKIQVISGDLQEGEKSNLHLRDRISEAKLYFIEAQRTSEKQSKLLVTSPDKLLEQKHASERTLDELYEEQQALEAQVSTSKKMEAYDQVLTEFDAIMQNCNEFEPLVKETDTAKQRFASLIRRKEELQTEIDSLVQKKALLVKRMDNLRCRYERLTSSTNQQLHGETVSKLPNEAEFLHSELERNAENIDDIQLDISALNEVMDEYRKSFQEQKSKLIAYIENFTEGYNSSREELTTKVTALEEYFMKNRNNM